MELSLRGIPADQARRYHDILAAELRRLGHDVLDDRETLRLLDQLGAPQNCLVGPCLRQVGSALGAGRVLVGAVVAQGSSYDINLTLLETAGGTPIAQATGRCDVCTADEGLRAFARAIVGLVSQPSAGANAGQTPPAVVWRADRQGPWYQTPHWRIAGFSAGLAALATGTALLVLDGSCTDGKNCPRTFEFTIPGVALIGVGALVASATALTYIIRPRTAPPRRVHVSVGPLSLGLTGRF